ncbi:Dihydroneopterin aldolase [Paenibacillus plantiphilus]|uniref:7,8-dihydroneopterin aldolase n=1 Tax=Paenibacillus plantiphilus TaxID=2905650 RepID=A0ABM9CW72_9BACL|nr:dihydroneopterin aldolase [Paenibacillus plantiphilus]CAH1224181.1 Dihydroneopterin aldolase [Paenibacillus plantiphilus]
MDRIALNGMRFFGYHGVFPEEKKLGQQYAVDVELHLDLTQAAETDDLNHTVNYAELHAQVKTIVEGPPFNLVEALAGNIASRLLDAYTSVNAVTVRVTKPHPPFEIYFDGMTVELYRKRDEHEQQRPAGR